MSELRSLLSHAINTFTDRPAFAFGPAVPSVITYGEAGEITSRITRRLSLDGCQAGDVVVSCADVCLESILLAWACFMAGQTFVPVDHEWSVDFLRSVIERTHPKRLFSDANTRRRLLAKGFDCPERLVT